MTRRGKRGNKSNTGEGDDPETGEVPSRYMDPAIDAELALYVREGMAQKDELETSEMRAKSVPSWRRT